MFIRTRFKSTVNKRGTKRADSFLMPKCWFNMLQTRSFDMFITSNISLTLIQRSSGTIWWTLAMLLSVVAVFGRTKRSSFPKLLRLHLNSVAQNFTVVNYSAESPYTESNSSLISVGVLPFKNKYLMTARYSILAIFIKTLASTHSHDCYITTARSKWLKLWWVSVNRWTTKFTSFYLRVLLSSCWGRKLFRPPSWMLPILCFHYLQLLDSNVQKRPDV